MSKNALILGITGQDGSYLAELLLSKGYNVHGMVRRSSSFNTGRIDHIFDRLHLHYGDITDAFSIQSIIQKSEPDELYLLSAMSHVKVSFETPVYTCNVDALGVLHVLEAVRLINPKIKIYNASSSEAFGHSPPPQSETTPFVPRSPYACAKVFAYNLCNNYRDAYDMFICNGILFNHESVRRGSTFVTKKVVEAVAKIKIGQLNSVSLGNLHAKRDWGHAPEFVKAMHMMLQLDTPDNFVIATGETHSVEEFVTYAFALVDLDWKQFVEIDRRYFRPTEVDCLCGDYSKAKQTLGWTPQVTFKELVQIMLQHELDQLNSGIKLCELLLQADRVSSDTISVQH